MTEIPQHLVNRARDAREKASAARDDYPISMPAVSMPTVGGYAVEKTGAFTKALGEWNVGADGYVQASSGVTKENTVGNITEYNIDGTRVAIAAYAPHGYRDYGEDCQDAALLHRKGGAVIDGVGGSEDGGAAAKKVVKLISSFLDNMELPETADSAKDKTKNLFTFIGENVDPGSSAEFDGSNAVGVTLIPAKDGSIALGLTGDCRALVVKKNGTVESLIRDPSRGNSPGGYMGLEPNEIRSYMPEEGDLIVLASDGIFGDWPRQFWADDPEHAGEGDAPEIAKIAGMSPIEAVDYLVKNSRKKDDKTVMVIEPEIVGASSVQTPVVAPVMTSTSIPVFDHRSSVLKAGDIIIDPVQPWLSEKLERYLDKKTPEERDDYLDEIDNRFMKVLGLDVEKATDEDVENAIRDKIENDFLGNASRFKEWAESLDWSEKGAKKSASAAASATPTTSTDPIDPLKLKIVNPFDGKMSGGSSKNKLLDKNAKRRIGVIASGLITGGYMGLGTDLNNKMVALSVPVAMAVSATVLKLKDGYEKLSPRGKRTVQLVGAAAVLAGGAVWAYKSGMFSGRASEHADKIQDRPTTGGSGNSSSSIATSSSVAPSTTGSSSPTTLVPTTSGNTSITSIPVGNRGGSNIFEVARFKASSKPGLVSKIKEMYPDLSTPKANKVATNILDIQIKELESPAATENFSKLVSNGQTAADNMMREEIARQVALVG